MTKKSILITLCMMFSVLAFSQSELPEFKTYHKNIYGEFFGSNILTGVNYDMRLQKGKMDGIGFRVGVGGISIGDFNNSRERLGIVTFPIELNHLIGKKRSSFVTGVGVLPAYLTSNLLEEGVGDFNLKGEGLVLAGGFATMGYRYQPLNSGLMFQVNWNPIILKDSGFHAGWISLGVGMGFK